MRAPNLADEPATLSWRNKKWMAVKKEKKEELLSPFLHVILDELGSVFLQDLIDLID